MKVRYQLTALAWLAFASPAIAAQGSGCLPTTGTVSGLSMAQYINSALQALISGNSGASPPSTDCIAAPVKGQVWLDTSVTPNVEKRYDGSSWVAVGAIDTANHVWSPPVGGGVASVSANTTTDICAAPAALHSISGTTPITSFGSSCVVGMHKTLIFSAATPITYNATSMILPGQRDYVASPGDMAGAVYMGAGNWRIKDISKADGSSVTNPSVPVGTVLYGYWGTIPSKTVYGAAYALPRSSYPDYLNAVTRVQSGTLTAGNNTITSVASTAGLGAGMPLEGTGIQAGTTIISVTSNTIVMSATATTNGSQSVRAFITGYGTGGDSTTVGVIDCRGRTMAGRPDMGGGDTGRLATANFGTSALKIGAVGGSDSHTLTVAQLPPITPTFTGVTDAVNVASTRSDIVVAPGNSVQTGNQAAGPLYGFFSGSIFFVAVNSAGSFTPRGNVSGFGSGSSHPIIQPTAIAECVVVVLP